MSKTTEQHLIARFCETFNVKSDRLATEYVHYDEPTGLFLHSNTETWGDSIRVSIEVKDQAQVFPREILSLEGYDEEELITDLAELFATLNYNTERFTKKVQDKYRNENEI